MTRLLTLRIALISFALATGDKIPFTSDGIASLKGRDVCQLEGEFPRQTGVFLDRRKDYAVESRERSGVTALFLLSKPSTTPNCGIVEDVLDLTPLIKAGEEPEFNCYTDHEGGTTWGKWGHVIGLADNHRGKYRFVKARLAWRVNLDKKSFEPMDRESVRCDTTGYED